jgi:hypothetical protein
MESIACQTDPDQLLLGKKYCNGFDQRVARQQLCKHSSSKATIEEAVFSVDPTHAPIDWLDSDHVMCLLWVHVCSASILVRVTEFVQGSYE